MKRISILLVTFVIWQIIPAQSLQIRGRVISSTSSPVEYANIILQTKDSVFITGGVTDQRGRFMMNNLKNGDYNLQISSIGYETKKMNLRELSKNTDLGNVVIDSSTIALDEVVITANNVINQADRKIILPTSVQLKASTNGLSLLQQINLNRIQVDLMRKQIAASGGGEVQLRINGAKSTVEEISALRPEDILRIEYHDDPGLRYNGAEAVIDYITRRQDRGGYISIDTQNSPHVVFGNNQLTAKINHKKSEFAASYYGGYRGINNMWRENTETFNFQDGTSLIRTENGTPDRWSMNWNFISLNYSYQEPDKYFFNATVRGNINGEPKKYYQSRLFPVDHPELGVDMVDRSSRKERTPSADLYYQHTLKNKQVLILNIVGTYINTESERIYLEKKENEILTDIVSNINGNKYSIIGEGIYEKAFQTGRLSAGIKHTQSFSDNEYSGSTTADTKMKQSTTYLYTEYQGKVEKFNYAVGVGGTRSWFQQSGEGYQNYTFRPTLRLTYNFNKNAFIRYRGNMYSSAPSLSDLSNTVQLIDSLQLRRGNPNLKPVLQYSNTITYNMRKGIFSTNLFVGHWYHHKPIMEQTTVENDKFIRSRDNQKNWQKLNSELELKLGPIKKILTLSFTTGINYFDSRGNSYHHTYTNWYYRAEAMANYKNWMAVFQIQNHKNDFYGETLNYGENYHMLGVMYRYKQITAGVMTLNPFVDNWKQGSENRNAYAPSKNWHYIKESSRLFAITFAYRFSFGRKYESGSKRMNNQDTDSGVLGGGK